MRENSLEILGIDGQQSDCREGRIDKKTHPGFVHLREGNCFLGTGNEYLCSEQIARVSESLLNSFTFISTVHSGTSCCTC